MVGLFCIVQSLCVIAFSVGSRGVCHVYFFGTEFLVIALWLISTCIAINIYVCTFKNFNGAQLEKLQYILYALILVLPAILSIVLLGTDSIQFEEVGSRCRLWKTPLARIMGTIFPFSLLLFINIVILFLTFFKIAKIFGKRTGVLRFFLVASVCLGFYRAPAMVYYITGLLSEDGASPDWSLIILLFVNTTESTVLVLGVSWYFSLFRLVKESIKQRKILSFNIEDLDASTSTKETPQNQISMS